MSRTLSTAVTGAFCSMLPTFFSIDKKQKQQKLSLELHGDPDSFHVTWILKELDHLKTDLFFYPHSTSHFTPRLHGRGERTSRPLDYVYTDHLTKCPEASTDNPYFLPSKCPSIHHLNSQNYTVPSQFRKERYRIEHYGPLSPKET
ncbi:hypothetical protein DV515_00005279 [Chloebia gouldiae]|uniref:Uncharacterized protein n=1 Tax=Chloebia gouldiae TaxID=44316 RepID=A0A3L8SNY0_CHLGU|nr:hypothetical protein DV515_00005279 [Chloebia gouldiae]